MPASSQIASVYLLENMDGWGTPGSLGHSCVRSLPFCQTWISLRAAVSIYRLNQTDLCWTLPLGGGAMFPLRKVYIYIYSLTSQISDTKLVSPRTEVLSLGEFKLFQIVFQNIDNILHLWHLHVLWREEVKTNKVQRQVGNCKEETFLSILNMCILYVRDGSGQLTTILWFFHRGQANY